MQGQEPFSLGLSLSPDSGALELTFTASDSDLLEDLFPVEVGALRAPGPDPGLRGEIVLVLALRPQLFFP